MNHPKWNYHGEEVNEIPLGVIGFVYLITLADGRKYIGKKLFQFKKTKMVKGKKKRVLTPSNWEIYYGSSDEIKSIVANDNTGITREILYFCKTKSEMNYLETFEIFMRGCLLTEEYVNKWVSVRINKNTVLNKVLQPNKR